MTPRLRAWLPIVVVAALGLALYLPRLGASGLWDPWEPKYAQAPREMSARGNWLIPYFHDDARLNKPPVTYWWIGAAQAAFGATEGAARLPSALLAVLCAGALALAFVRRERPVEGAVAGLALLTMPQWSLLARFATPDLPLAAALGAALAAIVVAAPGPHARGVVWGGIALAAIAVAALTDWPRGLLLPAWAALAWGALRLRVPWLIALGVGSALHFVGQHRYSVPLNLASIATVVGGALAFARVDLGARRRTLLLGVTILLVVVAPWFLVAWRLEPEELSIFEYKHSLNLGETPRLHRAAPVYVAAIVGIGGMPWSAAAIAGLLQAVRRRNGDDLARLLGGALVGPLLFFALAEAKMGHFYAVMQPAVAGLAAIGLVSFVRRADWRVLPAVAALALLVATVLGRPSSILEAATVKSTLFGFELWGAVAVSIGAWIAVVAFAKLARQPAWTVAAAFGPACLAVVLGMRMIPALAPSKSVKALWETYVETRREGEPIGRLGEVKFGCYYYSDNAIVDLDSEDRAREFFAGTGDRYLIVPRRTFEQKLATHPPGPGGWVVLNDTHPSHVLAVYTPDGARTSRFPSPEAPAAGISDLDGEGLVDEQANE
jgi:4-amino-4-deoxy-L-arabinose transferase-like glycosyltransferase